MLALGGLLVARLLPVTFVAPFFGGPLVPAPVKIAVAVALAVLLFPSARASLGGPLPEGSLLYVGLLFKELLVGFAIAFVTSLVFRAAEMAGQAVDVLRGANLATALAPELGERVSVFADFWVQTLVVLFLALGGHRVFLVAFAHSYAVLPLAAFPEPALGLWPATEWILSLTGNLLAVALALAAPALAALFLADVVLGLMARVAPQIQVFFLGMPLKALLAVAMVFLAAEALLVALQGGLGQMLGDLGRFLELLR